MLACLIVDGTMTPASLAAGPQLDHVEQRTIRVINRARIRHDLPRVRVDGNLNRAADDHCADMLRHDFFAHTSSDGRSMWRRVTSYRRSRRVGEILADVAPATPRAARLVVRMWLASPKHRAVILTRGFRRVGLARRSGALGSQPAVLFTVDFATRR